MIKLTNTLKNKPNKTNIIYHCNGLQYQIKYQFTQPHKPNKENQLKIDRRKMD